MNRITNGEMRGLAGYLDHEVVVNGWLEYSGRKDPFEERITLTGVLEDMVIGRFPDGNTFSS